MMPLDSAGYIKILQRDLGKAIILAIADTLN